MGSFTPEDFAHLAKLLREAADHVLRLAAERRRARRWAVARRFYPIARVG